MLLFSKLELTYLRMMLPTLRSSDQSVRSSSRSLWFSKNTTMKTAQNAKHRTANALCHGAPLFWCERHRCLGCCQIWSWFLPGPEWVPQPAPLSPVEAWKASKRNRHGSVQIRGKNNRFCRGKKLKYFLKNPITSKITIYWWKHTFLCRHDTYTTPAFWPRLNGGFYLTPMPEILQQTSILSLCKKLSLRLGTQHIPKTSLSALHHHNHGNHSKTCPTIRR